MGRITTVAGTGRTGFRGDGDRATSARLARPHAVAALEDGAFLIADTGNHRVRLVPAGAYNHRRGFGRARLPRRRRPRGEGAARPAEVRRAARGGGFLIADTGNGRVRFVSALGPRPLAVGLGSSRLRGAALRVRWRWDPLTALAGGDTPLPFRATLPAHALLRVQRPNGGPITAVRVHAARGRNDVPLPPTLHEGPYRVRLDAQTADGQHAVARGRLTLLAPRPLPATGRAP